MRPRRRSSRWNCKARPSLRQARRSCPNMAKDRQRMIKLTSNCRQSFNMGLPKGLGNFRQESGKLQWMPWKDRCTQESWAWKWI